MVLPFFPFMDEFQDKKPDAAKPAPTEPVKPEKKTKKETPPDDEAENAE